MFMNINAAHSSNVFVAFDYTYVRAVDAIDV